MATRTNWILSALFICITGSTFSGCRPGFLVGCPESLYHFQINAQILPDKDTVKIGDTIWVEINSPTIFNDQTTNEEINFSNATNLGFDMGFVKLINSSPIQLADAVNNFKFILTDGTETSSPNPLLIREYRVKEYNKQYMFKLGIVPKDTGIYSFNLGNPTGVSRSKKPCPRADFYMRLVQTNQHYYLYPGGDTVQPAGADYYFYVK